jgi:hypothetical protein
MLEQLRVMNISSQLARVEQVLQKKEELIQEKTVKSKEVCPILSVLSIRIRKDPKLFARSRSVTGGF